MLHFSRDKRTKVEMGSLPCLIRAFEESGLLWNLSQQWDCREQPTLCFFLPREGLCTLVCWTDMLDKIIAHNSRALQTAEAELFAGQLAPAVCKTATICSAKISVPLSSGTTRQTEAVLASATQGAPEKYCFYLIVVCIYWRTAIPPFHIAIPKAAHDIT